MAAKVYNVPEGIEVPQINFANYNYAEHTKKIEAFIEQVKNHVIKLGWVGEHVGEIIDFPVADGKAMYMVFDLKPVRLIHLPIDDAWTFQYVHLLTKKEVLEKIAQRKALNEMFAKRRANKS
jgi:hypothetical protein